MAALIVAVPLALSHLGEERYGLWLTLSALMGPMLVADLGISLGLVNPLARAAAVGDTEEATRLVSSAYGAVLSTALLLVLLAAGAIQLLNWPAILGVEGRQAIAELPSSLGVMVVLVAATIALGPIARVYTALQKGYVNNIFQAMAGIAALAMLWWLTTTDRGLPAMMIGLAGAPAIALAATTVYAAVKPPIGRLRVQSIKQRHLASLARGGIGYALLSIGYAGANQVGTLLLANIAWASAVPNYAVPARLFLVLNVLASLLVAPLWPAYADSMSRGETDWARRAFRASVVVAVAASLLPGTILVLVGRSIVLAWTGGIIEPSSALLFGLLVWNVISAVGAALQTYLLAQDIVLSQAVGRLAQVLVVGALLLWSLPKWGATSVAWCMAAGEGLLRLPLQLSLVRRGSHFRAQT